MLDYSIHHFGPDPNTIGGMATVIDLYHNYNIGGTVTVHPTWAPDDILRTSRLTTTSLVEIARLPPTAIVHVHLSERGSFLREGLMLVAASRRHLRTVATLHGSDFIPFSRAHPKLIPSVLGHSNAVLCLSAETARRTRELLPSTVVHQIPNPVVIDEEAPPANTTAEIVLFAGEIGLRKGADILLQAWPHIATAREQAQCIMVGPRTELSVSAQPRLTVQAPASVQEIASLLRKARVVVLPSRAEAMPMILIEAQGAGRPFVGTPVGAVSELAKHGGTLVPVGDAESLAEAVITFLEQPDYASDVGKQGQAYARDTRGIDIVDTQVRSVYDAIHG